MTKFTGLGVVFGGIHAGIMRYSMRLPMYASIHRAVFTCTFYAWAGYQIQKLITMKNMGQYKYSVDFAERHSVRPKFQSRIYQSDSIHYVLV